VVTPRPRTAQALAARALTLLTAASLALVLCGAAGLVREPWIHPPLLRELEQATVVAIVQVNEREPNDGNAHSSRFDFGCQRVVHAVVGTTNDACLGVHYIKRGSIDTYWVPPSLGLNLVIGGDEEERVQVGTWYRAPLRAEDVYEAGRALEQALDLLPARRAGRPAEERRAAETAWLVRAARVRSLRDECVSEILNRTREVDGSLEVDFDDPELRSALGVLLDMLTLEDGLAGTLAVELNARGVDAASDWVAWEGAQLLLGKREEAAGAGIESAMWALVRPDAPRATRIELSAHLRRAKEQLALHGRDSEAFREALRGALERYAQG